MPPANEPVSGMALACRFFLPERTSRLAATCDQKRMKNQQPVAVERTSAPDAVRLTAKFLPGREDLHQSSARQAGPNFKIPRESRESWTRNFELSAKSC